MDQNKKQVFSGWPPRLRDWSLPGKFLVTMIILMMAVALCGALAQIIVHDIIPTFWGEKKNVITDVGKSEKNKFTRGDIFGTAPKEIKVKVFYKTDEFIFVLKFVHIHLFGMSLIFIFMGAIVLFLDLSPGVRTWLIVLPFIGVIIDLASVWLKVFIHPVFFWIHIPGGGLFVAVFVIDTAVAVSQMWLPVSSPQK
jgi:hypothetical protein